MSFGPCGLCGGGLLQVFDVCPGGFSGVAAGTIIGGSDTQGFYLSADQGNHWSIRNKGAYAGGSTWQCAAVRWSGQEVNGGIPAIYAIVGDDGSGGGLLVSLDAAESWTLRSVTVQGAGNHTSVVPGSPGYPRVNTGLLAEDSAFLYAGDYGGGVYRAPAGAGAGGGGSPFTSMGSPGSGFTSGVCLDGAGALWAAFYPATATSGGIWKCASPHAGSPSWARQALPGGMNGNAGGSEVWDLVVVDGVCYAVSGHNGIWSNAGGTWGSLNGSFVDTSAGNSVWTAVDGYLDAASGKHVIAIGCSNAVKPPGGTAFEAVIVLHVAARGTGAVTYFHMTSAGNVTLDPVPAFGHTWCATSGLAMSEQGWQNPFLRFDPTDPARRTLLASGGMGFYRTTACPVPSGGGANPPWTIANNGNAGFLGHAVACDPVHPGYFSFGDSDWGGWTVLGDGTGKGGASTPAQATIQRVTAGGQSFAFAYDPDDSTCYTGWGPKYAAPNSGGGIKKRAYNAAAWAGNVATPFSKIAVGLCAFRDAGGRKILLAGVMGDAMYRAVNESFAATPVSTAFGAVNSAGVVQGRRYPVIYAGAGLVYAWDRVGALYRSADYGQTWTAITTPAAAPWSVSDSIDQAEIAVSPKDSGELWVSSKGGLYRLGGADSGTVQGGGITVTKITAAAVAGKNSAIAFGAGGVICATQDQGSGSGLLRSTDGGASWQDIAGDASFAMSNGKPENMCVGPDGRIYVSGSNAVTTGFASGSGPPPPPSAFTERQVSGSVNAVSGVLGLYFNQASPPADGLGYPSLAGSLLTARIATDDGSQVISAPPGWQLVCDSPSGPAASGVARTQIWAYASSPGALAGAAGSPQVFTGTNGSSAIKGRIGEYVTAAGTIQVTDQSGTGSGGAGTSMPVTAGGPNHAASGGMGTAVFAAQFSSAPAGQAWTTPAGWTPDGVVSNLALVHSQYYDAALDAGPTSVTGVISTSASMTGWSAALATFFAVPATPVTVVTSGLPAGEAGTAYAATLAAAGGQSPYAWALASGSLPPGLSLSSGGVISGTPSAAGPVTFSVTATDQLGQAAAAALGITVAAALLVTTSSPLPGGTAGAAYSQALAAAGGTSPYSWAVTGGSLPPGLGLSAGGTLAGTPALAGTFTFLASVTDSAGNPGFAAAKSLSVTIVTPGSSPLAVTTAALPAGVIGRDYSAALQASGGAPPYAWALTGGALPPGLSLSPGGTVSGKPSQPGIFTVTVTVTDSGTYAATYSLTYSGSTASAGLGITVTQAVIYVVPAGPWRILYGPPQPAGGYSGEILQAQSKTVTLRPGPADQHEVSFDLDGRSAAASDLTEMQSDITVLYGRQIIFQGRVAPSQATLDATAHRVTFTAYDYREVLRRRMLLTGDTLAFTGTEQASIAWQLIQATQGRAGGNLGIVPGAGQNTGVLRTWTFGAGDYVGDDITAMATAAGGFDWQLTPYGEADLRLDIFFPEMGASRNRVLAWGDARISSLQRTVDPSTYADAVMVTGDSSKSLTPYVAAADDIASRPEGRWDTVTGTQIQTQSALDDAGAANLAQAQVLIPSWTVTCYPGTWGGPSDIWIGDTVILQVRDGRLNVSEQIRVVEMDFALSADNTEVLTLTLGAIPFRIEKRIPSMLRRLRYLETR